MFLGSDRHTRQAVIDRKARDSNPPSESVCHSSVPFLRSSKLQIPISRSRLLLLFSRRISGKRSCFTLVGRSLRLRLDVRHRPLAYRFSLPRQGSVAQGQGGKIRFSFPWELLFFSFSTFRQNSAVYFNPERRSDGLTIACRYN